MQINWDFLRNEYVNVSVMQPKKISEALPFKASKIDILLLGLGLEDNSYLLNAVSSVLVL